MDDFCNKFDEYISNYDLNDKNLKLKYNHSYRVMNLQKKYSFLLGFDNKNIKVATLIGLLHDIGRFKQYELYHTFYDKASVDHADLSDEILFKDGVIKDFYSDQNEYDKISFSIRNHNKLFIEETDNEDILRHAKLIRDTDKLDIVYLRGFLKEAPFKYSDKKISPKVVENFFDHKPIDFKYIENPNDGIATTLAFAFDINYVEVLEELKKNFLYFYNNVNHDFIFNEVYEEVNKYIDERVNNNARKKVQSLIRREG